MKNEFQGFYAPSEEAVKQAWEKGIIVLDANVLLNLYKLPKIARDEFLSVLERVKEQLWIPHQVGLEFHRGRPRVIEGEQKKLRDAIEAAASHANAIIGIIEGLSLARRDIGTNPAALTDAIKTTANSVKTVLEAAKNSHFDVRAADAIRDALDVLLVGRIGPSPMHKDDLAALCRDGDERYALRQPPGFSDAKNKDGIFVFNSMKYEQRFGDLILWRQLLRHAAADACVAVIFVTGDAKEDWWSTDVSGKRLPHPELVTEFATWCGNKPFFMYSTDDFGTAARKFKAAPISPASIDEVREVQDSYSTVEDESVGLLQRARGFQTRTEALVHSWLEARGQTKYFRTEHDVPMFLPADETAASPAQMITVTGPFSLGRAKLIYEQVQLVLKIAREQVLPDIELILVCKDQRACMAYCSWFRDEYSSIRVPMAFVATVMRVLLDDSERNERAAEMLLRQYAALP